MDQDPTQQDTITVQPYKGPEPMHVGAMSFIYNTVSNLGFLALVGGVFDRLFYKRANSFGEAIYQNFTSRFNLVLAAGFGAFTAFYEVKQAKEAELQHTQIDAERQLLQQQLQSENIAPVQIVKWQDKLGNGNPLNFADHVAAEKAELADAAPTIH